jgi:pimeloyl-ACP methyl ester carboxylesterase
LSCESESQRLLGRLIREVEGRRLPRAVGRISYRRAAKEVPMNDSAWRRSICRVGQTLSALVLAGAAIGLPGTTARAAAAGPPPVPVLSWTDCGGGFQCATAQVPLDYERPRGRAISIALIRLPASDPAHRIGSLLVNPGGPGGSGVAVVRAASKGFPAELQARFDIVGFDPRGVGLSTAVRCFASVADQQAFFAGLPPFPVARAEQVSYIRAAADFDRRCQQRNADLLPHMSTANAARDMDLLRQALGESRLTYLGLSYGTFLGTTYANLFPNRVRALVLDGAIEPVEWTTGRGDEGDTVPVFLRLKSDVGASQTLGKFLDLCADAGPSGCPFAVGTDRQATSARFQALMARMLTQPVPVPTPNGVVQVTYAVAVTAVRSALYAPVVYPALALALQHLEQGDGSVVLQILGLFNAPTPTDYNNTSEAEVAIACADTDSPRNPFAWPAAAAAADRRSPYLGAPWAWASVTCANWPARDEARYTGPFDRHTSNTVLVVGNTFDPATRYQSAVALSHELGNARLLTLNGWGHTAFGQPSACANAAEVAYLVDLRLPAPGTVCQMDHGPFAAAPGAMPLARAAASVG